VIDLVLLTSAISHLSASALRHAWSPKTPTRPAERKMVRNDVGRSVQDHHAYTSDDEATRRSIAEAMLAGSTCCSLNHRTAVIERTRNHTSKFQNRST
jgi:hypothetical protein